VQFGDLQEGKNGFEFLGFLDFGDSGFFFSKNGLFSRKRVPFFGTALAGAKDQ